jgi:hypothetical protein
MLTIKTFPSIILLICASLILANSAYSAIIEATKISTTGNIKTTLNLAVYTDQTFKTQLTNFHWGTLSPGSITNQTAIILNSGDATLKLALTVSNWNPSNAATYLSIVWNRESFVLPPNSAVAATFTLNVSSAIVGITNFNVDIIIKGTY